MTEKRGHNTRKRQIRRWLAIILGFGLLPVGLVLLALPFLPGGTLVTLASLGHPCHRIFVGQTSSQQSQRLVGEDWASCFNPVENRQCAKVESRIGKEKQALSGNSTVMDIILDGSVNAVVNTISGGRGLMKDGFQIRRAALEQRIPCFTSLDTARATVEALMFGATRFNVSPYREYPQSSLDPTGAVTTQDSVPNVALPSAEAEA